MSLRYNLRQYAYFTQNEIFAIVATCIFGGFILTFNDWGDANFSAQSGLTSLIIMTVFLIAAFLLVVAFCKIISTRIGYQITYQPHYLGLIGGLVITVASAGFLPIFLPGGFSFKVPDRLVIGKWRGFHEGWEVGLIAGTFPLFMLLMVVVLNPLYLVSGEQLFLDLLVGACLVSVYALLPLPNVNWNYPGRVLDLYKHFRGATFGLEVVYASGIWWVILSIVVLVFCFLSYVLTLSSIGIGLLIYGAMIFLTFFCGWVYLQFFTSKHL